jgi:hypothetical protein
MKNSPKGPNRASSVPAPVRNSFSSISDLSHEAQIALAGACSHGPKGPKWSETPFSDPDKGVRKVRCVWKTPDFGPIPPAQRSDYQCPVPAPLDIRNRPLSESAEMNDE